MSQNVPDIDLLKKVDCFASLDDTALVLLQASIRPESYEPGDVICSEGEPGDWMFVVASGEVRVVKNAEDGHPIQVAVLRQGDVGGIQSVFEKRPRSATLLAHNAAELWVLGHTAFQSIIKANSSMAMAMLAFMSSRMRRDSHNLAMTLQHVGDAGLSETYERCSPEERVILDTIISKVMAAESLEDIMDFLFDSIRKVSPCNRISLAFIEEDGNRVVNYWTRADYEPVLLDKGLVADLPGSSLEAILQSGKPRVIGDLRQYEADRQESGTTSLILKEGIRSSMTCPLVVEGRPIGFLFRNSRMPNAYDEHQVQLHMAIADRLSQAVEKAYRIRQLTAANAAYFEMLGFVSHELKSPLGSIVMTIDVLLNGYLGELQPKQAEQLDKVVRKCKRLQELVGEYLNLSRIESGELNPQFVPGVDFVGTVLEPAIDIVTPQMVDRRMRLTRDWEGESIALQCAPDLLHIVMVNLLTNAIKYGNPGGEIRVKVRKADGRMAVSVWNEGPGFPEEERARLFRKFSRLQTPELLSRRGTGVGLYTSWRIIQSHHGRIRARSEHGKWAEFSFELPLSADSRP